MARTSVHIKSKNLWIADNEQCLPQARGASDLISDLVLMDVPESQVLQEVLDQDSEGLVGPEVVVLVALVEVGASEDLVDREEEGVRMEKSSNASMI